MLPLLIRRAPLSSFDLPRHAIMAGETLHDIRDLEASIVAYGLLNPIVVCRSPRTGDETLWTIVDGHKRLQAIKRMTFKGVLPRSLSSIPFIVADCREAEHPLSLLAPIEQFERVEELSARGMEASAIAVALYVPESYVADIISLADLSPRLKNAWFGGHIDLSQARAFATLPCPDSQDSLLLALGPFAGAPDIMDAIAGGATVVAIGPGEDDALILPSRGALAGRRTRSREYEAGGVGDRITRWIAASQGPENRSPEPRALSAAA